jgi:hypothetical protein
MQPRARLARCSGEMSEFSRQFLTAGLVLIALALVLTVVVFRKRWFERGYRKGEAKNPRQVRHENPPDR